MASYRGGAKSGVIPTELYLRKTTYMRRDGCGIASEACAEKLIQIINASARRVIIGLEMDWEVDRCRAIACVS